MCVLARASAASLASNLNPPLKTEKNIITKGGWMGERIRELEHNNRNSWRGFFLENKKRGCLENGKTDGPSAAIFKQSYAERDTGGEADGTFELNTHSFFFPLLFFYIERARHHRITL